MKILVTGISGFLGRAVAQRFAAQGDEVVGLVRTDAQRDEAVRDGFRPQLGTLGDPRSIAAAASGCEVIVHAAGITVRRSSREALRWTHVAGTENVVRAARHARVARLVHLSCADVTLVNADRMHWNEDRRAEDALLDDFSRTKMLAEDLALSSSGDGLEVTSLRPAWVWGPGDTSVLPGLCAEMLRGGIRLPGVGTNLLATTYVGNLVEAVVSASEALGAEGRAFYVQDQEFLDAREFFTMLSRAVEAPTMPRASGPYAVAYAQAWWRERSGADGLSRADVARRGRSSQFDVGNATKLLDYAPPFTVERGMTELAAWAKSRGGVSVLAELVRAPATDDTVAEQIAAARRAVSSRTSPSDRSSDTSPQPDR